MERTAKGPSLEDVAIVLAAALLIWTLRHTIATEAKNMLRVLAWLLVVAYNAAAAFFSCVPSWLRRAAGAAPWASGLSNVAALLEGIPGRVAPAAERVSSAWPAVERALIFLFTLVMYIAHQARAFFSFFLGL